MLEEVFSSHVLWYNDESVYIRTYLKLAHGQVKPEREILTRAVNPQAIAPERKDLAAGFFYHGLREVLRFADMFDEFHSDLLYKLKCRFPGAKCSAKGPVMGSLFTSPPFRLL